MFDQHLPVPRCPVHRGFRGTQGDVGCFLRVPAGVKYRVKMREQKYLGFYLVFYPIIRTFAARLRNHTFKNGFTQNINYMPCL